MAIHSSAVEDDDFSELGPQDSERFQERIKLATAKLDDIKVWFTDNSSGISS